jgi:polysaccharide export outer membrane protein
MPASCRRYIASSAWTFLAICLGCVGCGVTNSALHSTLPGSPHELKKVTPPPYVIEPPDILILDAVRLVPRPPYRIEALDILGIQVTNTLPNEPIVGLFSVEPAGTVNLGFSYGAVKVGGQTIDEAKNTIHQHMKTKLKPPFEVTVVLAEFRAMQLIRGEHLVRPDGTVSLGMFGNVPVDGLTIPEAKATIEMYLSNFLQKPEVSVDVAGFNSRVYYVITDGAGVGEPVVRLPSTGKETVLDAISMIGGLPPVASRKIWIARPAPSELHREQTLPVDWVGITQRGETATNYQILPGDRIYVKADPLFTLDSYMARIIAPVERAFGVTLLGNATLRAFQFSTGSGSSTGGFGF